MSLYTSPAYAVDEYGAYAAIPESVRANAAEALIVRRELAAVADHFGPYCVERDADRIFLGHADSQAAAFSIAAAELAVSGAEPSDIRITDRFGTSVPYVPGGGSR